MLRALRFWNTLLRRGRPGAFALLAILLFMLPSLLVWMAVLDGTCWLRDRLDGGRRPVGRIAHDATVAVIAVTCIPAILANLLLFGWLLLG